MFYCSAHNLILFTLSVIFRVQHAESVSRKTLKTFWTPPSQYQTKRASGEHSAAGSERVGRDQTE